MCNFVPMSRGVEVAADGVSIQIEGKGSIDFDIHTGGGKKYRMTIDDILYTPNIRQNLFSVSRLASKGWKVEFEGKLATVRGRDGQVALRAKMEGKVFPIDMVSIQRDAELANATTQEQKNNNLTLWHQRLGHLNYRSVMSMAKNGLVTGIELNGDLKGEFCVSCVKAKATREPFPNRKVRAAGCLDLIHIDVCGPLPVKTVSGYRYFLSIVDDHSHCVVTYLLQEKGEAFQNVKEFITWAETQTERKVKAIRSDNGGEFTSKEFKQYCLEKGIQQELTVPYNPESNGVVERMNRTLMERVRGMLTQSSMDKRYWGEALRTATYLLNRSPTTACENKTPYEIFTGRKPDLRHLRIFGCWAWAHIPKEKRKKLDDRARECRLLGFEGKSYRLIDMKTLEVFNARSVTFKETNLRDPACVDSPGNADTRDVGDDATWWPSMS